SRRPASAGLFCACRACSMLSGSRTRARARASWGGSFPGPSALDARDGAHQVVERDPIAGGEIARRRFVAGAGMSDFGFRLVGIDPEHIEGELAVNRYRLDSVDDTGPCASEHNREAQLTSSCGRQ